MLERVMFYLVRITVLFLMTILHTTNVPILDTPVASAPAPVSTQVAATSASYRIAFASDRDRSFYFGIYTMNPDGTDVKRLTTDLAQNKTPAWSPDGQRIAFTSDRDGNNQVYVMNVDGTGITRLTNTAAYEWEPAWSPDGKRIAFTSNRDGNWDIYTMSADGSDVVRIVNNPAYDWQPAWSPDGSQIAFTSDRDGMWQIYTTFAPDPRAGVIPDESEVHRLTNYPGDNRDPAWSPDGQHIAFVSTRDRAWEIYMMNAGGSSVIRLTHSTAINQAPSWSPDGKRIIYESNSEIMSIDVDNLKAINLTLNPAVDFHPSCSCLVARN